MLPGTHPAYDCNYDYKQYSLHMLMRGVNRTVGYLMGIIHAFTC